ncbi:hypothetical protein GEMRC1_002239 [Eukaryota sp. GEM-RC1]
MLDLNRKCKTSKDFVILAEELRVSGSVVQYIAVVSLHLQFLEKRKEHSQLSNVLMSFVQHLHTLVIVFDSDTTLIYRQSILTKSLPVIEHHLKHFNSLQLLRCCDLLHRMCLATEHYSDAGSFSYRVASSLPTSCSASRANLLRKTVEAFLNCGQYQTALDVSFELNQVTEFVTTTDRLLSLLLSLFLNDFKTSEEYLSLLGLDNSCLRGIEMRKWDSLSEEVQNLFNRFKIINIFVNELIDIVFD